jgi:hypothetical protein
MDSRNSQEVQPTGHVKSMDLYEISYFLIPHHTLDIVIPHTRQKEQCLIMGDNKKRTMQDNNETVLSLSLGVLRSSNVDTGSKFSVTFGGSRPKCTCHFSP